MGSTAPTTVDGSPSGGRTISTLLVANRGEIALRVIRTARVMGLRTVAVYSDADREAPHVRSADVAIRIGPTLAAQSYLSIESIIEAARVAGADAIHPGYGFLSERAEFARAVTEAGITFVGPTADVMEQMGRKDTAREIAIAAGVPVVPRAELSDLQPVITGQGSDNPVGYPLMVKAAAGGGGKGMRIVRDPADLDEAVAAATREAVSAFGDGTMLLERYVEHGRHVEVQVIADEHGHVLHLFERDCSAQRRHQKVIEEAPAPTIDPDVRRVLTDSAVALAKQVGYTNAGTVEFLVAGEPGRQEAYFLEMNTRLQVEHPVTEATVRIGGAPLDLVELQLRVAAGEPLSFSQDEVTCSGHAFEARVYAEDAFGGFLPQAGVAETVRWPTRARVDAALEAGQLVGTAYDPMLGKVIVSGPTRESARRALVAALDDTAILGLTTNVGFLRALADSPEFRSNDVDTAWLDSHPDALRPDGQDTAALLGAWAVAAGVAADGTPFGTGDGWRLGGPAARVPVELVVGGSLTVFSVGTDSIDVGGRHAKVAPVASDAGVLRLEIDDIVHEAAVRIGPHLVGVAYRGNTFRFERHDAFAPGATQAVADGSVAAPMPGTVLAVQAGVGDRVETGDVLGVVEAMKMELALRAPVAGTVEAVHAAPGQQVALGETLFEVDPG